MGSGAAFRAVLTDRTLRRLQYAVLGSMLGRFGSVVALGVWAYGEGGAALVGLAGFLRMAPGAVVGPFAATLADRYRRDHVMAASDLGRALLFGLAAVAVAADAPVAIVLILVAAASALGAVFEPARAAIMPSLVDRPELLTAVNAVSSAVNSCAYFIGPALGGFLLVVTSVEVVLAFTALALLWSAVFVLLLRPGRQELSGQDGAAVGFLAELREGVRTVRQDRGVTLLVGLLGLQTLIAGAVSVFVVVIALDKLDAGQAWVGILDAASGVGALIGVAVVAGLFARGRLSTGAVVGLALWGLPLLLVAGTDSRVVALLAMLLIGIGDTAIDVSAITLLQRVVPEALLGRIFGLYDAVGVAGLALGALLAPVAIALLGLDAALVVFGLVPVAGLAAMAGLRRLDARAVVAERPRALLRGLPMFAVLPLPTLDAVAMALRPVVVEAGATIFAQGDDGDRFYVIDEGAALIRIDHRTVSRLGPGEGFGEIALLHDVPRTATVVADGRTTLLALERAEFLAAVTGHSGAASAADKLVRTRLARRTPAPAAV